MFAAVVCNWRSASICSNIRNSSSVMSANVIVSPMPYAFRMGKHPKLESAVRSIHRFFEQILGTARTMTDVNGLPNQVGRLNWMDSRLNSDPAYPSLSASFASSAFWCTTPRRLCFRS